MEKIDRGGPIYYQFVQWAGTSALTHGVFTRRGGVSRAPWESLNVGATVGDDPDAVSRNLQLIYDSLELAAARVCTVWQVHSADTVIACAGVPGRRWLTRADGLITDQLGLALSMRFADCVPILLYDPVHHAIGLVHAGWRGTVKKVLTSTLQAMQIAYATQAADVQAAIGPSIGPDQYQVGPEVVEAVQNAFGTSDSLPDGLIHRAKDGSAYLNLWEANRLTLERAGVRQIEVAGICTAQNVTDFFSHRAEHGKTGRFCVVIALKALPNDLHTETAQAANSPKAG